MEVLNRSDDITLYNVELRHHITVPGYASSSTHILVFMDAKADTYYWVTSGYPDFEEGQVYNIRAKCNPARSNRLSYVKKLKEEQHEQVDPKIKLDAEDILFPFNNK